MATAKKPQRDQVGGRGIEDLPEEDLLKIASYLSAADLLSFSQTCSKLYRYFSPSW